LTDKQGIHFNKLPNKTYASHRIVQSHTERPIRIASKVLDVSGGYAFAREKDELVLRTTPSGRHEIKATFFEDDRGILTLTIQKFNRKSGPSDGWYFSFVHDEIDQLITFLLNIKRINFPDSGKLNVSDEQISGLLLDPSQAIRLLAENVDVFEKLAESGDLKRDLIAIGHRRKQLEYFERFLSDAQYFDRVKAEKNLSDESVWQKFFERNTWIFGYGLSFTFLTSLDNQKLEQAVSGASIGQHGKRTDALMKTQALISSLCYVEIKHHKTKLLDKRGPYRSGAWAPSIELSGAVAQVQATVAEASRTFQDKLRPTDSEGNPTGEVIFNFKPKSVVVVGQMDEFLSENGLNELKIRSFELYRANIHSPEIITFDELYHRAKFIVEHK
jgi:Domain of unknown function (DUF4263)